MDTICGVLTGIIISLAALTMIGTIILTIITGQPTALFVGALVIVILNIAGLIVRGIAGY